MSTIYKFPLNMQSANRGNTTIPLWDLRLEKVLHAGLDPQGIPCIWAKVTPTKGMHAVLPINLVGTGIDLGPCDFSSNHIGSFVQGPYVWHVFTTS